MTNLNFQRKLKQLQELRKFRNEIGKRLPKEPDHFVLQYHSTQNTDMFLAAQKAQITRRAKKIKITLADKA